MSKMIHIHVINRNGRYIAIHPESLSLFSVTEDVAKILQRHESILDGNNLSDANRDSSGIDISNLINNFIITTKNNYCKDLTWTGKMPKSLCLIISQDCNLRCGYCYADHGSFGGTKKMMSFDTAKLGIDKILGKNFKNFVLFFGGEPFMNFSLMMDIEKYGREIGFDINYSTITNGTVINNAIEEFIEKKISFLGLSLDGTKEINDVQRSGDVESVHDMAVETIERLKSKKYPLAIKCIATKNSINNVAKIAEYISSLGVDSIAIADVSRIPQDSKFFLSDSEFEIFAKELSDVVVNNLNQLVLGNKTAIIYPVFSILRLLITKTKAIHICSAGREYVAVTADGDVYPCHEFVGIKEFKMGNVHDEDFPGDTYNNIKKIFENRSVYTSEECSSCWARFLCGGECAVRSYLYADNLFKPTKRRCILAKSIIEALLPEIVDIFQDRTKMQNLLKSLNAMKHKAVAQNPVVYLH
jgi:uncharacterized protein